MSNSRFAVATHIMAGVALAGKEGPVSSELLASSINTHPVVVRRIIRELSKAGLLRGKLGKGGGSELGRPAGQISLFDVYQAVQKDLIFEYNPNKPNRKCPLSCRMKTILEPIFRSIDQGLEERLRQVRLDQLIHKIG